MLDRDDLRNLAIGSYAISNPQAKHEDMRLFSEGAIWALDYFKKQQRQERYRKAFDTKPIAPQQLEYQGGR